MANDKLKDAAMSHGDDVRVVTTSTGPDRYTIVAATLLKSPPAEVWQLLLDWEQLLAVGLPGMTGNFRWLTGSPDEVPSTFEFELAGASLKEEIYDRSADKAAGRYLLRYRALEPALGVLEYDAVFQLEGKGVANTAFSATRDVRLAPGTSPEMLAGMVESETRCLENHFAS